MKKVGVFFGFVACSVILVYVEFLTFFSNITLVFSTSFGFNYWICSLKEGSLDKFLTFVERGTLVSS